MAFVSTIRRCGLVLGLAAFIALGGAVHGAGAQTTAADQPRLHVLLIAGNQYEHLPFSGDMPSATADAFLLADVLMDRGARSEDVRLVTDGAPTDAMWSESENAAPSAFRIAQAEATRQDAHALAERGVAPLGAATRARILEELDRLVRVAEPGDQAFIAMAGHGEQQPTDDREQEPDGFDEAYLPVDFVRRLDDGRLDVAVLDDEIGERVRALLDKGVQVVFVGDFCHSEGGTRGAGSAAGGRADMRLMAGAMGTTDDEGKGLFTGFYAAPSLAQALGLPVPYWASDPSTRRIHGALTYYLATALQDPTLTTMRDVAVRVERDINMHARESSVRLRLPPPQFEGEFGAPLPGSSVGLAASLWQVAKPVTSTTLDLRTEVSELTLPAGVLNGVEPGAIYSLSQTWSGREQVILYGRAEDVSANRAILRPVAAGDLGVDAWTDLRTEEGQPMTRPATFTARLFAPGAPETVWIARPAPPADPTPAQAEALADLDELYAVQARGLDAASDSTVQLPAYVRLVDADAAGASLSLAFENDNLVLVDDAEDGRSLASMDLDRALERIRPAGSDDRLSDLRASLAEGLAVAARFQRIRSAAMRVSDATGQDGVSSFDGLALSLYRHRPAAVVNGECADGPWADAGIIDWAMADGAPTGTMEIDPTDLGSPGGAQVCDTFVIEVRNEGSRTVAMSALRNEPSGGWDGPCARVAGGAGGLAALAPDQTYACTQPVSVGLVAFDADSSISALSAVGGETPQRNGATRLTRGGRVRYVYQLTEADPAYLVRMDFMILAARSLYRQDSLPVHFSQLCQRPLQDAFVGPMAPGETAAPDPCLAAQGRFRSARAASDASAPPAVDGLFALLSGEATRGDSPQPVGGTAMRRLTLQVTPRAVNE
ncbi:MAG: caspase family protein [Alphaproteobacteria bacterium]|nr:caspase family protein [Alphaproteobacteria bacterium]MBU2378955.1 caspase family protein [Alphaproteobacteria bacterium]